MVLTHQLLPNVYGQSACRKPFGCNSPFSPQRIRLRTRRQEQSSWEWLFSFISHSLKILQENELSNMFTVTTLYFMSQTAAADRFEIDADGQIQLVNYMETHPLLIQLGMIHSHPQHPCFLSSVDIHNLDNGQVGFMCLCVPDSTCSALCQNTYRWSWLVRFCLIAQLSSSADWTQ